MPGDTAPGYDVIVLGVGTMGAGACLALARRGVRVLGLEQFQIPHAMGSHHGHSRVFRLAYYEHPDYVPLLLRSLDAWRELNTASGQNVFRVTGGLYMAPPECDLVRAATESAVRHGLAHERLNCDDLARRFPQFRVPEQFAALYEPLAGVIRPELAVAAMAAEAFRRGAEIRHGISVRGWSGDGQGVRVETSAGMFSAHRLVITAGPWSGSLLRGLGVPLQVTRQVAGWVRPIRPDLFAEPGFPCWGLQAPDGHLYYGFPLDVQRGLKLARHAEGEPADPASIDCQTHEGDDETFRPALHHLPDADGPTTSMSVCMYTNSPDRHFIIDRHPTSERVVFACGFSGHGFKFAPIVGEALADLALNGRSELPIGFLGLTRFNGARSSAP